MWLAPSNSSTFFLNMKCVHENEHQRIAGNGSWFWDILVDELLGLTQIENLDLTMIRIIPHFTHPLPHTQCPSVRCVCVWALQMI